MQLTRCSTALLVLTTGLGVFFWLFNDIFSLILLCSLASLLFYRAFIFSRNIAVVCNSLNIRRNADKTLIRRGSDVAITTSVECRIPPGTVVSVTDILPGGANIVRGKNLSEFIHPGFGSSEIRYRISLLSIGRIGFGGVTAEIRDSFFISRFHFRKTSHKTPYIWVEPVGPFRRGRDGSLFGEWDEEKRSPLRGSGVISFRDYVAGDDPRSIDWKLTAKHGKMYVREYTGLSGFKPLFIVDFSNNSGESRETWDRMAGSVLQAVRDAIREKRKCSLILICGVNLIKYISDESSVSRVRTLIAGNRSYQPAEYAYRYLDAGPATYFQKRVEREIKEPDTGSVSSQYLQSLWNVAETFLPGMQPSVYDTQVVKMLKRGQVGKTYIFSLFQGDLSHIRALIYQSRLQGIHVTCEVPDAVADPGLLAKLTAFGPNDIQVIK